MRGLALVFSFLLLLPRSSTSQVLRKDSWRFDTQSYPGLAGNSITDILFDGCTLWVGTAAGLSKTADKGESWTSFDRADGIGERSISALAVHNGTIWVATAFDTLTPFGTLPAGGGLSYSTDGGATWTHIPQPGPTPIQNITYDIAFLDSTIWITSWGGGLRKSSDMGQTWEVVTPDTLPFDPFAHLNHRAFSVITVGSTIWVGTAAGVNKSTNGGRTWTNFNHQNQQKPISGNFVVALGHQRFEGRDVIWAATVETTSETGDTTEFRGVSKTEDGGFTWTTMLRGEFAHNFAFDDSAVYVATDNGLYKSIDGGKRWACFPQIFDSETGEGIYTTEFYSVAVTPPHCLWAGSADGLVRTEDNGFTWKIFRSFQPPGVSGTPKTYAYPNPFSPLRHNRISGSGHVRVQYRTTKPTRVTIKIYDFGMNLVKTVVQGKPRPRGDFSEVWDGRNERGDVVANGVYFYKVEMEGEEPCWGKIIIMD